MKANSIMSLNLYKYSNLWCFDDEHHNIVREPFVMGMSEIISSYLPEDTEHCNIMFSNEPFPNSEHLILESEEYNGGWYRVESNNMRGWLCPVTRIYMQGIPKDIYFQVNEYKHKFNLEKQ